MSYCQDDATSIACIIIGLQLTMAVNKYAWFNRRTTIKSTDIPRSPGRPRSPLTPFWPLVARDPWPNSTTSGTRFCTKFHVLYNNDITRISRSELKTLTVIRTSSILGGCKQCAFSRAYKQCKIHNVLSVHVAVASTRDTGTATSAHAGTPFLLQLQCLWCRQTADGVTPHAV